MNKFEAAARLLKALRKLDDAETTGIAKVKIRCGTRREELLKAAPVDVRELVLAEVGK